MNVTDNFIPCRRPHFTLRSTEVYFLLSNRPCAIFDDLDSLLWSSIDGDKTVGTLRSISDDAQQRIQRMVELELCEWVPEPSTNSRTRVLVLEPHMDDATLSVGGTMWTLREECEFTLVTIAARSNFTSYYFLDREYFDADGITELRRRESELVMRLLGGKHEMLEGADAPLRYQPGNWSLDWFRSNRRCINARLDHCSPEEEITAWTEAIANLLRNANTDEIWMPLGVGGHTDHELSRNACLRALRALPEIEKRSKLYFYQDVPYANQFPAHTQQILAAINAAGGVLHYREQDIDAAFSGKLRLNSIYGSQFKMSYMAPKLEACARAASKKPDGMSEILYRVDQVPVEIPAFQLYSGRNIVEKLRKTLAPWLLRHRRAKRIRIVSLVGFGCWEEDMKMLFDTFPEATFEIYLSDATAGETARFISPRIEARVVRGRGSAWFGLLAKLAFSWPHPQIVMTGVARQQLASVFRFACPFSDSLSAISVNLLIQAIRLEFETKSFAKPSQL